MNDLRKVSVNGNFRKRNYLKKQALSF